MDREAVAEDWRSRGFSCELWRDPPGQVWKDYVHPTDELLMILEGVVELEMQGRRLRPKAGEEILIPAKTVHTVRNAGKSESKWLYGYKERAL
ncbi:MAG: cupin domain-containing protein [Elusimicrobia bacterium RIFCSPLOWO2_12_FULL_59_9]|nr:MAG: cupin domain-containing protein [Elusimicrobia bacterium RIFCSPLOWO2_12_FULL_59_9]